MKPVFVSLIVILGLFLANIFMFVQSRMQRDELSGALGRTNKFWKDRVEAINQFAKVEIKYEYTPMDSSAIIRTTNGKNLALGNVFGKRPKIVFCIPEQVCSTCNETTFTHFNTLVDGVGRENVAILVPSNRLREIMAEFNNKNINANIYGVDADEAYLKVGKGYVPFFFVLDGSYVCKYLFVPNPNNPGMTLYYLRTMKDKLFAS